MCTTGSAVWLAICTMQPILPAATNAAPVLSIAAALRVAKRSGERPAEEYYKFRPSRSTNVHPEPFAR